MPLDLKHASIRTLCPKKYAHGFCFAVLCCGYTLTDFPIPIRLTSLALWQSNDCPSASKATLINMDKYFMWMHCERLHNHNQAKHNKAVCIFLGMYCTVTLCFRQTDARNDIAISLWKCIVWYFFLLIETNIPVHFCNCNMYLFFCVEPHSISHFILSSVWICILIVQLSLLTRNYEYNVETYTDTTLYCSFHNKVMNLKE